MTAGKRCQPTCSGEEVPTAPHQHGHATERPQQRFYPTGESEELYFRGMPGTARQEQFSESQY